MNIKIGKLTTKDWEIYKKLSLEFFKDDPLATGNSYEEKVQLSDKQWVDDFNQNLNEESAIVLVAAQDGIPIGIIMGTQDPRTKMHHVGLISRFYIKKEFRCKGIGKRLFGELTNQLESNPEIIKLNLDVTTTQESAINLYKSFGFEIIGEFKKEYLINGRFYDIYEMEKYLSRTV